MRGGDDEGSPAPRSPRRDIAVVLAVAVIQVGGTILAAWHQPGARPLDVWGVAPLALGAAALWWRGRWPAAVLLACFLLTTGYELLPYPRGPIYASEIVALITALIAGRRRSAYAVLLAGFLATWVPIVLLGRPWPSPLAVIGLGAWLLLLAAIGELVRYRRALATAERQRIVMTARMEADEIERRTVEDRLRFARELHDVLCHNLAVINVQASAGLELFGSDPARAVQAMEAVRVASRDALTDVQSFVDSLHGADAAPREPAPTIADLDALVAHVRAAGVAVRTRAEGHPRQLPAAVDLAACRVVREALTNVVRHVGRCEAVVSVTYSPTSLGVRVENLRASARAGTQAAHPVRGGGRGITGMRARVGALGGTLEAGPGERYAWAVVAEIPTPVPDSRSGHDQRPAG